MLILNKRKNEPYHCMLKIESFSLLSEAPTIKIESNVFEASGHNWRLDLYPNGNEEEKGGNHISLYVTICGTESLSKGWEVCVDVNFFIYDHMHHNFVTFQDIVNGNRTKFNEKKLKWGFDKLISLDSFKDSENGYLLNDSCVFGAEVFAIKEYFAQNDRCLSMTKPLPVINTHTWTINNFTDVTETVLLYEIFKVGNVKWRLYIHPQGIGKGAGEYLSIYLKIHDVDLLPDGCRVYAKYRICVKNQIDDFHTEHEPGGRWYDKCTESWGFECFMPLKYLIDPAKCFMFNGSIIIEIEFVLLGTLKSFI